MKAYLPLFAVLFIGCTDSSTPATTAETASTDPSSSVSYEEALVEEPCALLTPDHVSEAVGVSASELSQQEIMGSCRYSWEGGEVQLARVTILESAEQAQGRFEQSYQTPTPEGRARGEAALQDELDQRREDGEISEHQAGTADKVGGVISDLAAATIYVPIEGIGDQAVYDGTVHTMETQSIGPVTMAESQLHLRTGNLLASVSADLFDPSDLEERKTGPSPEDRQRNREVTLALGYALLEALGSKTKS